MVAVSWYFTRCTPAAAVSRRAAAGGIEHWQEFAMRIAIIGQQDFGKAVLEAMLGRGDTVAAVFCAPEQPGAKPDPLRVAAQERNLPLFLLPSLKTDAALHALRALDVELGVMAYVLQFVPHEFATVPRHGMIQHHSCCCRATAARVPSTGRSFAVTR